MGMELVIAGDSTPLQLPDARNKGAEYLWTRLARLPDWLPQGVAARQFIMAVSAEANALPADTDPGSIVATAFNCAVVGLIPGKALMHAHFVPFKKGKDGPKICQLIVGYRGFLELAYGCKFLRDVQCEVVLEGETFRRWNDAGGAMIEHELPIDRDPQYPAVQAAYCIWHGMAGGRGITTVGRRELDKTKARAERKYGSVWGTDPIAMSLKTPLRRSAPRWKMTDRMGLAVTLDGLAEVGEPQPLLGPADDEPARPSLASLPEPETDEEQAALIAKAEQRAAKFGPDKETDLQDEAADVQGGQPPDEDAIIDSAQQEEEFGGLIADAATRDNLKVIGDNIKADTKLSDIAKERLRIPFHRKMTELTGKGA